MIFYFCYCMVNGLLLNMSLDCKDPVVTKYVRLLSNEVMVFRQILYSLGHPICYRYKI